MISTERDAPSSVRARHAAARVAPARGPGRLEYIRAAGERPPRARPQRRGSPGPIPNPAVKPAFAESTAARGCGRAGRRARGGRFSMRVRAPGAARAACAERGPQGGIAPAGLLCIWRHWSARRRDRCRGPSTWPADCVGAPQARLGPRGDSSRVFYLDLRLAFAMLVVMAPSHLPYCCGLSLDFVGVFLFSGCWPSFWWV